MQIPTPSLVIGIAAGLAAAFLSALSYLVLRHHGTRDHDGSATLLVFAHVLMGIVSLPVAWLTAPWPLPPAATWLPPLLGSTCFYLMGQVSIFTLLKKIDASRVAPLLGLKIAILAWISSVALGHALGARQWLAVALSVVAAAMTQRSGAAVPWKALGRIMVACLTFAISDLFIVALIDAIEPSWAPLSDVATATPMSRLHAGGFALAITYILCGLIALPFIPWGKRRRWAAWNPGAQYALAWLGAMVALYTCFGLVGAVFGNILQSTRGIMAVGLGTFLASMGWHDLEQPIDRQTLVRRLAAATLMTAAIAIYAMP